jgi:hypothetical protein
MTSAHERCSPDSWSWEGTIGGDDLAGEVYVASREDAFGFGGEDAGSGHRRVAKIHDTLPLPSAPAAMGS